jgi:hypothetical protein
VASIQTQMGASEMEMNSALDAARALFTNASLPFPNIPAEFVPDVREVGKWQFEANAPTGHPYNMHKYVRAARGSRLKDYLVLAHAGHGVNSYAIHYFQVQRPLCVFLQIGWGGVYMDTGGSAEPLKRCFELTARLTEVAADACEQRRLGDDDRIIVTVSDFYGSGIDLRRRGGRWRSIHYDRPEEALEGAIAQVTSLAAQDDPQTREKRRALERLGDARAHAFFRAAHAGGGRPLAIQHVNQALDRGLSLESILLSDDGTEYSLAVKGRGRRFAISFGWSDGRGLIGDGGEWEVEFDKDGGLLGIQAGSVWMS